MKKIDLHVHSTYSDGTFSPAELVKEAVKNGISAFALTDHDTTDGIDEAIDAGGKAGIEVIPGIEISTSYKDKEIHIVGLFIDYKKNFTMQYMKKSKDVMQETGCLYRNSMKPVFRFLLKFLRTCSPTAL